MDSVVANGDIKKPDGAGVRHLQVFMVFLCFIVSYSIRVSMGLAIVAMTDSSLPNSVNWTLQTQSYVMSGYNWGYLVLKVPGGELAARVGGKVVMAWVTGTSAAASLLLPIAGIYGGWKLVFGCRVLQGLAAGAMLGATHNLLSKWVPRDELSLLTILVYGGGPLGTAMQYAVGGVLAARWGWSAIFYFNGVLGAATTALYGVLGAATPAHSRLISGEERAYIQRSLGHVTPQKRMPTPWKSLFTSVPFLSVVLATCGYGWGYWTVSSQTPTYLSRVMGLDIKSNGMLMALFYLTSYITSFPCGYCSDLALRRQWLSATACRKISNSITCFGQGLLLTVLTYASDDVVASVAILIVTLAIDPPHLTGYTLVPLDMAPTHAGTMIGIMTCAANVFSVAAPLAPGVLIQDENDPREWRKVFLLAAGMLVATNLFYVVCGTSQLQPWNAVRRPDAEDKEKQTEKPIQST